MNGDVQVAGDVQINKNGLYLPGGSNIGGGNGIIINSSGGGITLNNSTTVAGTFTSTGQATVPNLIVTNNLDTNTLAASTSINTKKILLDSTANSGGMQLDIHQFDTVLDAGSANATPGALFGHYAGGGVAIY